MSRKGENMIEFGEFENKSGTMDITDPCYDQDIWCRRTLKNVLPGIYKCFYHKQKAGDWGERIWSCRVIHKDCLDIITKNPTFGGRVGVDAGLCGFFDNKPDYNDTEWHELCGKIENTNYYVLPYGCFTSSGIGDGEYDYYLWKNEEGKVVAAELRFL
jgi:hypothetical protein